MLLPTIDADADGLKYVPMAKTRLKVLEEQRKASGLPFIHRRVFSDGTTTVDVTASEFAPKIRVRTGGSVFSVGMYTDFARRTAFRGFTSSGATVWSAVLPEETPWVERHLVRCNSSEAVFVEYTTTGAVVRYVSSRGVSVGYELSLSDPRLPSGSVMMSSAVHIIALPGATRIASASLDRVAFVFCLTNSFPFTVSVAVFDRTVSGGQFHIRSFSYSLLGQFGEVAAQIAGSDDLSVVYMAALNSAAVEGAVATRVPLDLHVVRVSDGTFTDEIVEIQAAVPASDYSVLFNVKAAPGGGYAVGFAHVRNWLVLGSERVVDYYLTCNGVTTLLRSDTDAYLAASTVNCVRLTDDGTAHFRMVSAVFSPPLTSFFTFYGYANAGVVTEFSALTSHNYNAAGLQFLSTGGASQIFTSSEGTFALLPSYVFWLANNGSDTVYARVTQSTRYELVASAMNRSTVGAATGYSSATVIGVVPRSASFSFSGAQHSLVLSQYRDVLNSPDFVV